jgi:tripartite-type tricarboxylate transporter receptor subunit TctC
MDAMRRLTGLVVTAVMLFVAAGDAFAQTYPERPIRWILGYPAGGISDLLARTVAQRLSERLGQQVVVDNRSGASGVIGAEAAARAKPDGYTLFMGETSTHTVNPLLKTDLPYDPVKDFAPVTLLAESPLLLVVSPSVPAQTVPELIALAKERPGQLNYASGGNGTGTHLAAELFKSLAKVDLLHVPYKGTPHALTDLLGGRVEVMFPNMPPALPHVKANTLRVLAVTSARRLEMLPGVPALSEYVPGAVANTWYGLFVPAGTPPRIITRLNGEIGKVLAEPELRRQLSKQGFELTASTAEQLAAYLRAEAEKWSRVIAEANIRVD